MSKQVIDLAIEISKSRDSEVPIKLLKIAGNLIIKHVCRFHAHTKANILSK